MTDLGRSPDGSGYSAEPEPKEVSAVPVSIPNASELRTLISRVTCCLNGRELCRTRIRLSGGKGEFKHFQGAVQEYGQQAELLAKVFEEMGGLEVLADLASAIEAASGKQASQ